MDLLFLLLKMRVPNNWTLMTCWTNLRTQKLEQLNWCRLHHFKDMCWYLPRCMRCRRGLAMRILSVCPSVCPSHACIVTKRKKDLSRFVYYTKEYLAHFSEKKNGWYGATPSTWNFGSTDPRWSKIADFQQIIARRSSAITSSEKSSINANRKSTTRFPMSLRWSSYVSPKSPKGGLKNAKRPISIKKCILLEESLLQSFFVWKLSATKL